LIYKERKVLVSILLKPLGFILNALWAVPIVLFIRLCRPVWLIRVGSFWTERIGHFVADVAQRRAQTILQDESRGVDLYWLPSSEKCANRYWATVTQRWFKVSPIVRYISFWNRAVPLGDAHCITPSETGSRDLGGFLERARLRLPTVPSEERLVIEWMEHFGWRTGDPFVCLLVRDSTYLTSHLPDYNWDYHSYRDSDIQSYVKAVDYLTSQNVFVFRMGRKMAFPMNFSHPKFVDYAFRVDKSDFLDVWLFANCSLCISTGSGPDMVSNVFCRPILSLNFLPLQDLWSWSNALHYPKILRWKRCGELLSLSEYLTNSYHRTSEYKDAGIIVNDLTENQILDSVKESWERLTGYWNSTSEEKECDERFKEILKAHSSFRNFHGFVHPESRLATTFLKFSGRSFLT